MVKHLKKQKHSNTNVSIDSISGAWVIEECFWLQLNLVNVCLPFCATNIEAGAAYQLIILGSFDRFKGQQSSVLPTIYLQVVRTR